MHNPCHLESSQSLVNVDILPAPNRCTRPAPSSAPWPAPPSHLLLHQALDCLAALGKVSKVIPVIRE